MYKEIKKDNIVNGMDWMANEQLKNFELSNYRKYQYELIEKQIGVNILEVGSGDRSFTKQIVNNKKGIERLIGLFAATQIVFNWMVSIGTLGDHRQRMPILGLSILLQAIGLKTVFKGKKNIQIF